MLCKDKQFAKAGGADAVTDLRKTGARRMTDLLKIGARCCWQLAVHNGFVACAMVWHPLLSLRGRIQAMPPKEEVALAIA